MDSPQRLIGLPDLGTIRIVKGRFPSGVSSFWPHYVEDIQIITEENQKQLLGTLGGGLLGGILLGPVGLVAGALIGGRRKEIFFLVRFTDGTKMLAAADSKTFQKIFARCLGGAK